MEIKKGVPHDCKCVKGMVAENQSANMLFKLSLCKFSCSVELYHLSTSGHTCGVCL